MAKTPTHVTVNVDVKDNIKDLMQRRGLIAFPQSQLAELLDIPKGMHIAGVYYDHRTEMFEVMVFGKELPVCNPATEAPLIPTISKVEDGRIKFELDYKRWENNG